MNQDLCITFNSLVELFVRDRRFVKGYFVGNDEGRLCLACDDEVSKVSIVCFDIALPSAQLETLTAC